METITDKNNLKWDYLGPSNVSIIRDVFGIKVKVNNADFVKKGRNYICWFDRPGFKKEKWIMHPNEAYIKSNEILSISDVYYTMTWTIYNKNDISENIVDYVFNNSCSLFYHLVKESLE